MSTIPSQEATADPELQNSGFKHFDTKCPESGLKCGYWIRYYSERAKEFEAERHILAKRVHDQRLEIVRLEARRPPTPAADQQTELESAIAKYVETYSGNRHGYVGGERRKMPLTHDERCDLHDAIRGFFEQSSKKKGTIHE